MTKQCEHTTEAEMQACPYGPHYHMLSFGEIGIGSAQRVTPMRYLWWTYPPEDSGDEEKD